MSNKRNFRDKIKMKYTRGIVPSEVNVPGSQFYGNLYGNSQMLNQINNFIKRAPKPTPNPPRPDPPNKNVIFIICDELTGLKHLDKDLLDTLVGINKFKKRCAYFNNYYVNTLPCSPSRAVLYTGKNANDTGVSDNIQSAIPWQDSMKTVSDGVKTIGSYFKNTHSIKYAGKAHFRQQLDPANYTRFIPRISTQKFMGDYDFPEFSKMGDYAFDRRVSFFNDKMVTQETLPSGSDGFDFFDSVNNVYLDGVIPFMRQKILKRESFLVCCNYNNPHDILYSNVDNDIDTLQTPSLQITGSSNSDSIAKSVGLYNDNFTKYGQIEFFNKDSVLLDNSIDSITNKDQLNIAAIGQILSKYTFYGIEYSNLNQYQQYQTAYYRCIKQLDDELNQLYDFMESNGLFENSIVCLGSDHGDNAGAHGLTQKFTPFYDTAINIPLFLSYPNMPNNYIGKSFDFIASTYNLLPTLLSLYGYTSEFIKSEGLSDPFIDNSGSIIESDYNYLFSYLSVTFGPVLYLLARAIPDETAQTTIREKFPTVINYLTIQGFSVCTKFQLGNTFFTCGYYFSILHVYAATIKYLYQNNLDTALNLYDDSDELFILQDYNYKVQFAYVDTISNLYLILYSDPIVKNLFEYPVIVPYTKNSLYNLYLYDDPIYECKIYGLEQSFYPLNVYFLNILTPDIVFNVEYVITSTSLNSKYIFIGNYDLLEILLSVDDIISTLIDQPIIVPKSSVPISNYKNYILHPLIGNVFIGYNISDKSQLLSSYSNESSLNNSLMKLTINYPYRTLRDIIATSINTAIRMYEMLKFFNSNNLLRLPGVDYSIEQLIDENFQVQLFDYGNDPQEIVNLVDSSRIDSTSKILISQSYQKLYNSIKFNNLTNLNISLPINLFLTPEQLKLILETII
jgi:arylsulfatase A-like enzyme